MAGSGSSSDVSRLENEIDEKNDKIVKLTATSEAQLETIRSLRAELERTREYLEYAEAQFISLERGLQSQESKASAVATLAEAKLAYDKRIREDAAAGNLGNVRQARGKIAKSEELLTQKRYAASVYFAKRAKRLLETEERTVIHVVSVHQANLRRGPGLKHRILHRLTLGTVLVQTGAESDWYEVKTKGGVKGWVHQSVTTAP
jgi:uncharacterized protein YgiM (DUF1202 family)